jgi:hypothetical protein
MLSYINLYLLASVCILFSIWTIFMVHNKFNIFLHTSLHFFGASIHRRCFLYIFHLLKK